MSTLFNRPQGGPWKVLTTTFDTKDFFSSDTQTLPSAFRIMFYDHPSVRIEALRLSLDPKQLHARTATYELEKTIPTFFERPKDESRFTLTEQKILISFKRLHFKFSGYFDSDKTPFSVIVTEKDLKNDEFYKEIMELGNLPHYKVRSFTASSGKNFGLIEIVQGHSTSKLEAVPLLERFKFNVAYELGRYAFCGSLFRKWDRVPRHYIIGKKRESDDEFHLYSIDNDNVFHSGFALDRHLAEAELSVLDRIPSFRGRSCSLARQIVRRFEAGMIDQQQHYKNYKELIKKHVGRFKPEEADGVLYRLNMDPYLLLDNAYDSFLRIKRNFFFQLRKEVTERMRS